MNETETLHWFCTVKNSTKKVVKKRQPHPQQCLQKERKAALLRAMKVRRERMSGRCRQKMVCLFCWEVLVETHMSDMAEIPPIVREPDHWMLKQQLIRPKLITQGQPILEKN